MFLTTIDYVFMGIGVISVIVWIIFYFLGNKYDELFVNLEEKEYPLKELYGVGYAIMELSKYDYRSKGDRKLRQSLGILYPAKYTEYYIRIIYAQRVTIAFMLWSFAFILYGLTGEKGIVFLLILFAFLSAYYFGAEPKHKIEKRSEEMLADFPEVVSNLALLTNAGLVLREAWEEVANSGDRKIYQEMKRVTEDMNNGISEADALYQFGLRCVIPEIKKFSSTIIQGILKGNKELANALQEQSKEVWADKKQNVRRQGEKAASKLLIPIFIMFAGILVMIVVPIFTNLF